MADGALEGEVHQLVTSMGIRKWKKRYMIVKSSNLFFYEKQEEINNPHPLLKVSFYEIKVVTEATFIGDQGSQQKRDAHNCGFKVDYGGHHSLSLQANSQEERRNFVECLQEKKIFWQQQTTPTENRVFFDKSTGSVDLMESCVVDPKDPLGLVGKEEVVQIKEGFEGTCSVRLLYSDGSTQNTTLSSNMTGNDVLEQVQDLSSSSGSTLWLLDTKGVVQNLKPDDKPGPKLARLYGICVVEPQNRVFVVHLPSGDWLPLILNKGVNCQQIIQSKQIKTKISDNQISNAALFIRKSTELQVTSLHTAGDIQLPQQECPAELLYNQTPHGVEHKETILILRTGGSGAAVTKTERNRTMTMKDKYALLSSPLSKAKNQRNFEMIYDEAIENLESDPLQSSVIVPKFNQGLRDSDEEDPNTPFERLSDNTVEDSSLVESSVELLPTSEPRGRLAPLHSTSPSKTEGVKKLFNKTFHSKRVSAEILKEDETPHGPSEHRRGRATALSISKDDEHMGLVDEAIKHSESHPFEMSIEESSKSPPKPHYKPPLQQLTTTEESKIHLVRPSSLAPILSAREIARHVTSAKTPDEEINPLSPTSITLQEIAKYPTIKNSPWQLMENNSLAPKRDVLDRNAILSDLQARANPKIQERTAIGATKLDERQPIIIPKAMVGLKTSEARAFQIISPALLRTWVLNKANNPPPKIQVNKSILEWKINKWVLASDSQYSEFNMTGEENKSIFKLPGEIELVFYDKSRTWSVTGPKILKPKTTSTEWKKKNGGSNVKTEVVVKKVEFTRQAVAEYSNTVNNEDELGFNEGDVMFIVSELNNDWLVCMDKEGRKGYVPKNYVTIQDYKPPTPPPSIVIEEEPVKTKPEAESEEAKKGEGEVIEKTPELPPEVVVQPPEPVIDLPTRLAKLLREKLSSLQNAIDPIIWHSGATRDPEMKKQLFDDRKTPAIAVLIRGNLTSSLAEIILRGMKSKSSFFQIENNNIWDLVQETVKYRETIPACASAYRAVEDICILSEVTNSLGSASAKFRSFVCQALNNHFLESWLYSVFFDLGGVALESMYNIDSFVTHSRHPKIQPLLKEMLLVVQPLDALGFQLSIKFERDSNTPESKWFTKGGIGKKFSDLFVKTMTLPITPIPPMKSSSRAASRENISAKYNMTSLSVPSSPTANGEKRFVILPGESVTKGTVTVDTATDVAIADPAYRTIGPKKSIEQLSKIVDGDSKIPEETPEDVKI